jgi:hypothetical protein
MCGNGYVEPAGADGILGNSDDEECDVGLSETTCCDVNCKLKVGILPVCKRLEGG